MNGKEVGAWSAGFTIVAAATVASTVTTSKKCTQIPLDS